MFCHLLFAQILLSLNLSQLTGTARPTNFPPHIHLFLFLASGAVNYDFVQQQFVILAPKSFAGNPIFSLGLIRWFRYVLLSALFFLLL